ncbi:MAG: acyl-CoA dehydrogenase family protein [Thermodesulfobacteriota bacterium]|nr:acyl-CoA dehydrogenase family protein [Thermodesulfobacteriota bacterium]
MSFMNPFTDEHEMFRKMVSGFVKKEIKPNAEHWEEMGEVPREVFLKLGDLGILGTRYDEKYGGSGLDFWYTLILCEELAKSKYMGAAVSILMQCEMCTAAIHEEGSEELKQQYLVPAIKGELLGCLGVTEPSTGSDVGSIRTTARREGDSYIINGAKTFITNGSIADYVLLAVRTGGQGTKGVSLIVIPTNTPGFSVGRKLKKMGVHCSATTELSFEDCVVPASNIIGEENAGFKYIMHHFQGERIVLCGFALGAMEALMEEAVAYGESREISGRPVLEYQVWRHKLADLYTQIMAARQLTYLAVDAANSGIRAEKEISMAKLFTANLVKEVANEVLQMHGGYGYMEEYPVCRIYRDVAAFTIGGGTNEVMREIIAKQSGL